MSTAKTEDAEDHEIFDINDFTTASDWERCVAQFDSILIKIIRIIICNLILGL